MKILFITAGIVPVRGVSNSYQEALMDSVAARGHDVACLCTASVRLQPGVSWTCEQQKPYRRYAVFNGGVYPAAYAEGGVGSRRPLRDVQASPALSRTLLEIVNRESPEVISLQSLFGLPFDLLEFFRGRRIPVVFTAHDYFALCPTAHLFLPDEKPCRLLEKELVCHECCGKSPSYRAFWLSSQLDQMAARLGSRPVIRNTVWRMRNAVKRVDRLAPRPRDSRPFSARRRQAVELLKRVDVLHCISERQAMVFREICGLLGNIRVLPLVPPTIDRLAPVPRLNPGKTVSFVALNVNGVYKGSKLLEETFKSIATIASGYELHVYGNSIPGPNIDSVFYHGRYKNFDLDQIAANADFCIVPSIWDETLCFVGLEMLARGVPLIVSCRAGVGEFIEEGRNGVVFDPGREGSLRETVLKILRAPELVAPLRGSQTVPDRLMVFKDHVGQMASLLESAAASIPKNNGLRGLTKPSLDTASPAAVEIRRTTLGSC